MSVATAINKVRVKIAAKPKIFTGTCSLIPQIKGSDGFHGHKMVDDTVNTVTGVPCDVEEVSGGFQVNDGGTVVTKTHRLKLPVTAQTMAITRKYIIAVNAEGLTPAVRLAHPVTQLAHKDVFLRVSAQLAEGYGQPAVT